MRSIDPHFKPYIMGILDTLPAQDLEQMHMATQKYVFKYASCHQYLAHLQFRNN